MAKQLTNTQFLDRITELVGTEYTFNEPYVGRHHRLSCTHNTCGHTWNVEAGAFLGNKNKKGSRCPKCYGNATKTTKEFVKEIAHMYHGEYTLISPYKNAKTKVYIRHNKCGNNLYIAPNTFLCGVGCAECNGGVALTHEKVKKEITDMSNGEYQLVSQYNGCFSEIKVKHIICGCIHSTTLALIRAHNRVPMCRACYSSVGESLVTNFLMRKGIEFNTQVRFADLKQTYPLSYDFLINDLRLLIEYQGVQHYRPVELFGGEKQFIIQQEHDRMKREYATANGYTLLEIPFTVNTQKAVDDLLERTLAM